jgi:hypothetical protein
MRLVDARDLDRRKVDPARPGEDAGAAARGPEAALRLRLGGNRPRDSPPTAPWTSESERIVETFEAGKLSCEVELKTSREKWLPGFSFVKSRRAPPFSCSSCLRSLGERPRKPPELFEIRSGRVTDMSVPRPVRGFSTLAWASSSPAESALTAITRPTPVPRPSAVRSVRPRRRRSSESM